MRDHFPRASLRYIRATRCHGKHHNRAGSLMIKEWYANLIHHQTAEMQLAIVTQFVRFQSLILIEMLNA